MGPRDPHLVRGITRVHLLALAINCVIGSGVLGLPAVIAADTGTWALACWAGCAVVVLAIALCQGEVGSRFTSSGGPYLYAAVAFGPAVGFVTGWLSVLTRILAFASVANLFVVYASQFAPALGAGAPRALLVAGVVVALGTVLVVGIRWTAWASTALTAAKLALLGGFVVAGLLAAPGWPPLPVPPPPDLGELRHAAVAMMFAFAGFEAAAIPAAETRDPQRDLPFALAVGLLVVTAVYTAVQHVCTQALPDLARAERPVAEAAAALFGPAGATAVAGGALAVLLGTLLTQLLGTSRLLHAMAERGELPAALARVDGRFHVPLNAILTTAAAATVATVASSFLQAVSVTVATRVVTWGLVCASLPVLRRRADVPATAFRLPAGDVVAVAAGLASVSLLAASTGRELALTAGLVAAGFALRWAARRAPSP